MRHIGEGIAVIPTAPTASRNGDVEYRYRPDSDFYYLTGFREPESVAVLIPGRSSGEFIIFCRERDPHKEMWDGERSGLEGVIKNYGADDAFPIDDLEDILPNLLENRSKIYCNLGRYPNFDNKLLTWIKEVKNRKRTGVSVPGELADLGCILHEFRLIKRPSEIKAMKKAAAISSEAHKRAMSRCKPGLHEYQIEAELEYVFRNRGAQYTAYPSIVAGGANACILHYIENSKKLRKGDLLLIDAGAELDCYCADITRTFPVSGRFTSAQRDLYEVVLDAQISAISKVGPGCSFIDPHLEAVRVISYGLKHLKLLRGSIDEIIEKEKYKKFFMHRTSHWLGLDVHDVGDYQIDNTWRLLEPGMVLTIEPGVYIPSIKGIPKKWHNIGIRIEDDILVTRDGNEVLTQDVPKSADSIEALMSENSLDHL